MRIPKPSAEAVEAVRDLTPVAPGVSGRLVFGQPAAFVNGHMFLGAFGAEVFVRLSAEDRTEAQWIPGVHPFEPMPGRAMSEYVVLPRTVLDDRAAARRWVARSVRYASALPVKKRKTPKKSR